MNEVIYMIRVNRPCRLFIDDEEMMILDENKLAKITLPEGEYLRKVVAIDNKAIYDEAEITFSGLSKLDTITLDTTGLEEAKRSALPKDEFQVGDLMYKALEDGTGVAVAKYVDKNITEIIIPEEILFGHYIYEVKEIGNRAFQGCSGLTSVTIGNSVTSIGDWAFEDCSGLTSITIPNSVTSIGWGALEGTAFYNNPSNWDNGALYLGDCLIRLADGYVGDYNIKENTRLIADAAFSSCTGLTSVTIPNSVTSIGEAAFDDCSSLTSVTLPNSVTSIGEYAFFDCSSLTSITIPKCVTSIGEGAFRGCSALTSITIPNSVTTIEDYAFKGCTGLTSITISNSVTSIGNEAFYFCSGLTSFTIPNSVTSIGEGGFRGCSALTSITIPNSVTSIGWYAFDGCKGLTSVTIANGVTSIGNRAFEGCTSLTSVVWNAENCADFSYYSAPFRDVGSQITSFTFDDSVKHIPACLCYEMSNLTSLTIPKSVTSIGKWAFYNCSSLTSITIPNSVTSIGEEAFYECSSLTSVTIPNSVTSIGERAFYRCKSLTSITIPNSVTSIGSNAFYDCFFTKNNFINNSSLDEVANKYWGAEIADIEQDGLLICNDTVVGCRPMVTSVIIPDTITCIGNYAFQDCSALTSITIPNSVTYIGDWAFQYCTALTSITIPNSVTTMGGAVFYGCSSLASVVLPENMTSINTYVDCPQESAFCFSWGFFEGCSSLTSLTIPNSVTSIGELTFKGCSSLKSIIIPDNVTTLGAGLFHGCSSLESVVFSKNIQYIPSSHTNDYWEYFGFFGECNALKEITLKSETPPPFDRSAFDGLFSSIAVYVPCGSVDLYKNTDGWNEFTNIQEPLAEYAISLVYDEKKGHATVDKNNYCSNQISAIANYGYHFTQWSDGVTDNPRSLVLTQDTTLTAEFAPNQYAISTLSNDLVMGSTMGDTVVNYLEYVTIWAEANYGYHFTQWNDGVAENPRTLQVTNDGTYTAQFEKNVYTVTYFYNSEQGAVEGVTSAEYLDVVVLNALPHYGYHFTQWSDGVTENPRSLILTQDTTFTAEFEQSYSGQCGENLYWEFNSNVLTITGSGTMYDERPWGLFVEQIQKVSLPVGITHIGNDAFQDCLGLRQIDIPYTVESIGDYSFNGCRRLYYINCYPLLPPYAESTSFSNYSVNLYAPCDNLDDYRYDMVFGQFKYFECIGSESTTTDGVVVKPGSTDVTITWPTDDDAATYSIEIKKNDEIFCILIFNAEGQLLNISFAPSRDGNNRASYAAQAANGLRFTVTGLEEKTTYGYDVTSKDEESNTLDTYSGEFTTAADTNGDVTMGTDELVIESSTNKLLINGQLCLLRDGKIYNVMGVEIQ